MKALRITDVKPDKQASQLGILEGDYILSYDGIQIDSDQKLSETINKCKNNNAKIVVYRNSEEIQLTAKPGPLGVSTIVCDFDVQLIKLHRLARNVLLTTAHTVEGHKVLKTHEIITSECVYGMNLFKDVSAAITDIFGGRSNTSQTVLKDLRKTCLRELRYEAASLDANAVIAVDLDYSEFSGGGKSMLFLVASGTAVTIEPLP